MQIEYQENNLDSIANKIRATCIKMAHEGKEGHLSSALSCADILVALYFGFLKLDVNNPSDESRDRLIFSKGHGCTALYATLALRGFFDPVGLSSYAHPYSRFPNHSCKHALNLVEYSSGSLGHGLGVASGIAYAARLKKKTFNAIAVLSDGECNEGSVWESVMFGAAKKLERLIAIVDNNNSQAVGVTSELIGDSPLENRFKAFGWNVSVVNGHSIEQIQSALKSIQPGTSRPTAIIAKTVPGYGVSFMEKKILWHYRCPNAQEIEEAYSLLGEKPIY